MGTISHNAMVITSYEGDHEPLNDFCVTHDIKLHGPFASEMNGYVTFLLPPDGSKEGWPTSEEGNERRAKLANWLSAHHRYDWVDVRYGELGSAIEAANEL